MTQKLIDSLSSNTLINLISKYRANKVFLVTGKQSFIKSGAKDLIDANILNINYLRFSEFEQNPKYEDALRGMKLFLSSGCEIIIAIGGGSVLDMAKLINIFAANTEVSSLEIVKDSKLISKKGKPLIAIPTTAGTGSEATHFAVVYHDNKKYSVAHKSILPDVAILVNSLTASQPKHLTACAGLDAFSQAIESYWSVNATEESKAYAREAILLLIPNLVQAVNFPNKNNRQAVMKGAYFAGKAINISKTTAAHAVSYAFTTYYGIPHGHAVFLTLPEFFEHNSNVDEKSLNDARGVNYVKNIIMELCEMFNTSSVSEARDFLRNFAEKIQIELSINKLDLLDCEDKILENVNIERLKNNPRSVSKLDLRAILKRKIGG